jgi:hypothetical protein
MNNQSLLELGKSFYEHLNTVPAAERYLRMFNRSVEFRMAGRPVFHYTVRDGKLSAAAGAAAAGEMSALQADAATWESIFRGQLSFFDAGAGYAKNLRCVGGISFYPDISWVGILTRLAQESRV